MSQSKTPLSIRYYTGDQSSESLTKAVVRELGWKKYSPPVFKSDGDGGRGHIYYPWNGGFWYKGRISGNSCEQDEFDLMAGPGFNPCKFTGDMNILRLDIGQFKGGELSIQVLQAALWMFLDMPKGNCPMSTVYEVMGQMLDNPRSYVMGAYAVLVMGDDWWRGEPIPWANIGEGK